MKKIKETLKSFEIRDEYNLDAYLISGMDTGLEVFFRIPSQIRQFGSQVDFTEERKSFRDGDPNASTLKKNNSKFMTPAIVGFKSPNMSQNISMEKKRKVEFASEVVGGKKDRRVVFDIKCEAQDENHAVKVLINNHLKYQDKIIRADEIFTLTVSIGLRYLGLDNTLTLIDQTESNTSLLVFEIKMSIFEEN